MTRRNSLVLAIIALAFSASPSCVAQQIFWARCVPTSPREIWLHGRDLWKGSEYDTRSAKATLNGVALTWDRMSGANGHDANRALPYAHRFIVPDSIASADDATLNFTRNDGATATTTLDLPEPLGSIPVSNGNVCYLDAPIVVRPGAKYDGNGDTYTWSSGKTGVPVVVHGGATVSNLRVFLPVGHDVPSVVCLPGSRTTLAGVEIINHSAKGVGVMLADGVDGATIRDSRIVASRCIEANPNARLTDCNFYRLDMSHFRGSNDGQCGRGFQGSRHLVAWCHWHDIDRGPTIGPWGSPNDRSLYWECVQERTGVSQGASEGLLFESFECVHGLANVSADGTLDVQTTSAHHVKPGYYVVAIRSKQWARIKTAVLTPTSARITTDPSLPSGLYDVRIGNAIVENTIARCSFSNGRSGIWLFGCAMGNAFVQNDYRELGTAVVGLNRTNSLGCAFQFANVDKFNRYARVDKAADVLP